MAKKSLPQVCREVEAGLKRVLEECQVVNNETSILSVTIQGSGAGIVVRSADMLLMAADSGESVAGATIDILHQLNGTTPPPF